MMHRRLGAVAATALMTSGALAAATLSPSEAAESTGHVRRPVVAAKAATVATQAAGLIVHTTSGRVSTKLLTRTDSMSRAEVTGTSAVATGADTIDFDAPLPLGAAQDLADKVADEPGVISAEPNRINHVLATPPVTRNDYFFKYRKQPNAWDWRSSFDLAKGKRKLPKGGYSTRAPYLWRAASGSGVIVAVIDTGITTHPDLARHLSPGWDFFTPTMPGEDRDGSGGRDSNPADPGDWAGAGFCAAGGTPSNSSWHGTHVAGIITARRNNTVGLTGLAPLSRVQPIRAMGPCGGTDADVVAAIIWAAGGTVAGVPKNRHPAKVINLSLGSDDVACGAAFQAAVNIARSKGAVVVAAAGNSSRIVNGRYHAGPIGAPATCQGVISVAASDEIGQRAVYGSVGPVNDIAAPGGNTYWKGFSGIVSTTNAGTRTPLAATTYVRFQGTSMAAPAVSSAAALMSSLGYRRVEIERALRYAVQRFPSYPGYRTLDCTTRTCGRGILDLSKVPAPFGNTKISGTMRKGKKVRASTHWTGNPRLSYRWYRNGKRIKHATKSTYRLRSSDRRRRITVKVIGAKPGFKTIFKKSAPRKVA